MPLRDSILPAIGKARDFLLSYIDGLIAKAPPEWVPGLEAVKAEIAADSALPAELVANVLTEIGKAVLSGDFGPATSSDTDIV